MLLHPIFRAVSAGSIETEHQEFAHKNGTLKRTGDLDP
jgi:hypothetical protein